LQIDTDVMIVSAQPQILQELQHNNTDLSLHLQSSVPSYTNTSSPSTYEYKKKGKNFTIGEDELLVESYLCVSQDPLVGKDQKASLFWQRIYDKFIESDTTGAGRTPQSLTNRWAQIQKSVNKFCGAYAQVELRNESGKVESDKIIDAKKLYYDSVGLYFKMDSLWKKLRHHHKWKQALQQSQQQLLLSTVKRGIGIDDVDKLDGTAQPIGKKAAKAAKVVNTTTEYGATIAKTTEPGMPKKACQIHKS
jgi:hypothetical protein